ASPLGRVYGIDYSPASVAAAGSRNSDLVAMQRVDIRLGEVSQLPFENCTFDAVTAIETHYYWPNLVQDLREVRRALRSNGRVGLVVESYASERPDKLTGFVMRLLGARLLSAREHAQAIREAGFVEVKIHEDNRNGWLCAIGVNEETTAT